MYEFHQYSGNGFSREVLPYRPDEIASERVQAIAEFAVAVVNADEFTVGIAFPQLKLPAELLTSGTEREQRGGYAGRNADSGLVEVVFNGTIATHSVEEVFHFEGCKSIKNGEDQYLVKRPKQIIVTGLDRSGNYFIEPYVGLNALFHQHEADHVKQHPITIMSRRQPYIRPYSVEQVARLNPKTEARRLGLITGR